MWNPRTILVLAISLVLGTASTAAAGSDASVVRRLTKFGGMNKRSAAKLSKKVGARMSKSADNFAPANDPLRVAVSQELFGQSTPRNAMDGAKIRLRLFGGLNSWALETLFKPRSGQIAACKRAFSLKDKDCAALVAAAGNITVADARKLGGGAAGRTAVAAAKPVPARRAKPAARPAAPAKGRFGAFDSGFRSKSKGRPAARPAARPAVATRRAPARPVATRRAPQPANNGMSTADAYRARRAARLARLQEERKRKKEKMMGGGRPAAAPASAAKTAPGAKPATAKGKPSAKPAAAEPEVVEEAPAAAEEPPPAGLDEGFLDGLLDDPLGGD